MWTFAHESLITLALQRGPGYEAVPGKASRWRSSAHATDCSAVLGSGGDRPKLAVLRRLKQRTILFPPKPALLDATEAPRQAPPHPLIGPLVACHQATRTSTGNLAIAPVAACARAQNLASSLRGGWRAKGLCGAEERRAHLVRPQADG
jgi:hypothetical protein